MASRSPRPETARSRWRDVFRHLRAGDVTRITPPDTEGMLVMSMAQIQRMPTRRKKMKMMTTKSILGALLLCCVSVGASAEPPDLCTCPEGCSCIDGACQEVVNGDWVATDCCQGGAIAGPGTGGPKGPNNGTSPTPAQIEKFGSGICLANAQGTDICALNTQTADGKKKAPEIEATRFHNP